MRKKKSVATVNRRIKTIDETIKSNLHSWWNECNSSLAKIKMCDNIDTLEKYHASMARVSVNMGLTSTRMSMLNIAMMSNLNTAATYKRRKMVLRIMRIRPVIAQLYDTSVSSEIVWKQKLRL